MKFKKRAVLGVLLSTGLYLLDNLRERMPDNMDDIKGKARETYETASDRLGRATDALRGKEDSQILGKIGALLLGVGVGVGVGLLIAPARGEETRADIAKKVSDFGEKVSDRERKPQGQPGLTENKDAQVSPYICLQFQFEMIVPSEPRLGRSSHGAFQGHLCPFLGCAGQHCVGHLNDFISPETLAHCVRRLSTSACNLSTEAFNR